MGESTRQEPQDTSDVFSESTVSGEACPKSVILASLFLLGGIATSSQTYLTREALAVLEGNELVLALILGGWLAGVGFGALLSGLSPKARKTRNPTLLAIMPPILLGVSLLILRCSYHLLGVLTGQGASPWQTLFIIVVAVLPVSACTGFVLPPLASHLRGTSGEAAGRAFTWDAVGSFVAGIFLTFLFLPRIGPFVATTLLLGAVTLLASLGRKSCRWMLVPAVLLWLMPLMSFPQRLEDWTERVRWTASYPKLQLLATRESRYQHLALGKLRDQYTLMGNNSPLFSFPNEYENRQLAHVFLSQTPTAKSVLLLSDRGRWLIPHIQTHDPERLVCCGLDSTVDELVRGAASEEITTLPANAHMVHADPRAYLRSLPESTRFDCILVDQVEPTSALLNRLYTLEFYRSARSRLADGGVLVFSVPGVPNTVEGESLRFAASLHKTLSSVFQEVLVLPGPQWTFFAANEQNRLQANAETIVASFQTTGIEYPHFAPEVLTLHYQREPLEALNERLRESKNVIINTDRRPIGYLTQFLLWLDQAGIRKNGLQRIAVTVVMFGAFVLALQLLLPSHFPGVVRDKRTLSTSLMLGASGFLSIGLELLLLVLYQSAVGCLYQTIGLFFGLFMLGLAAGAACGLYLSAHPPMSLRAMVALTDSALVTIAVVTPSLCGVAVDSGTAMVGGLLLGWLGLVAFLAGLQFPLVASYLSGSNASTVKLTALLEGADHLGGALGAPLVGLFMFPLLGLQTSCAILAFAKAFFLFFFLQMNPARRHDAHEHSRLG